MRRTRWGETGGCLSFIGTKGVCISVLDTLVFLSILATLVYLALFDSGVTGGRFLFLGFDVMDMLG